MIGGVQKKILLIQDEVIKNYNDEQTQTNQNSNDIRR